MFESNFIMFWRRDFGEIILLRSRWCVKRGQTNEPDETDPIAGDLSVLIGQIDSVDQTTNLSIIEIFTFINGWLRINSAK